jgi:four helix bundle protein
VDKDPLKNSILNQTTKIMDFTEMPVWQNAIHMLTEIYRLTKLFPAEEKYGLISDMRRAANSVAHNIAEGSGRFGTKDKTRFYKMSRGSAFEIISQCHASAQLLYIDIPTRQKIEQGYRAIIGQLTVMIKSLER